jgi:small subunit ribosomal protein S4e
MAKKGGSRHTKKITLPKNLPITNRKHEVWHISQNPGKHKKDASITMASLLRDVLGVATDISEVKKILSNEKVKVDGRVVKDHRYVVGIMDIISLEDAKKHYRMQIVDKKLRPKEITETQAKEKLCKVTGKRTDKKGIIIVTTHDGRNYIGDNKLRVGSTIVFSVPEFKLNSSIALEQGAKCLVISGKHAGIVAELKSISAREGSMPARAILKTGNDEFTTIVSYIIAVQPDFE